MSLFIANRSECEYICCIKYNSPVRWDSYKWVFLIFHFLFQIGSLCFFFKEKQWNAFLWKGFASIRLHFPNFLSCLISFPIQLTLEQCVGH